ncbi:MAG: FHA domain-containing protein [Nannocystis sp.]|nr:FHA domain-containing protein [Nannocystis sp.]MBK7827200.1 FHA domain-containing protein [Nannocystis sp.]
MIRVVLERPDQPPLLMVFSQPVVVVGRGETDGAEPVDWQLSFPDVSRRHCRLSCAGGRRFVEGLSERSPTYVNGRKTQGMTAIEEGDEIRFGYCVVRVCEDVVGSREAEKPGPVAAVPKVKQGPRAEAPGPAAPPIVRLPAVAPVSASVVTPSQARQVALADAAMGEDVSILVERARHWDLRGRPAGLLLSGPMLQRGRTWLRVGPELGEVGGLVRLFIERSAQARRSWLRGVGLAAGVTLTTALTGSAVAWAWLPGLRIPEGPPPPPPPASQCNQDVRERVDALTAAALQQGDDATALLLTSRALQEARGGGCRNVATAEPTLRALLAKRHSRLLDRHDAEIDDAVVRRDGSHVAAAAGGRVKIWDVEGQRPAVPLDYAADAQVLAWSGDDRWLAVGTRTGGVAVWDVNDPTQAALRKELKAHRKPIQALAFSPEGGMLASADGDALRLWDMGGEALGEPRGEFKEIARTTTRLQFNEGASRLIGLSGDKVRIWPIAPPGPAVRLGRPVTLPADGAIVAMAVDQEGTQIVTGDTRGVVLVWRLRGNRWSSSAGTTHASEIVEIRLRPRQDGFVSLAKDRTLSLVDLAAAKRQRSRPPVYHLGSLEAAPRHLAVDPSGRRALTIDDAGVAELWNLETHETKSMRFGEQPRRVKVVTATSDQSVVVAGEFDGSLRVWDLLLEGGSSGAHLLGEHRLSEQPGKVPTLALSREGTTLASTSDGKQIQVWSLNSDAVPSVLAMPSCRWSWWGTRTRLCTSRSALAATGWSRPTCAGRCVRGECRRQGQSWTRSTRWSVRRRCWRWRCRASMWRSGQAGATGPAVRCSCGRSGSWASGMRMRCGTTRRRCSAWPSTRPANTWPRAAATAA